MMTIYMDFMIFSLRRLLLGLFSLNYLDSLYFNLHQKRNCL